MYYFKEIVLFFFPGISSHLLLFKHVKRHTSTLMDSYYFGDSKVCLHEGWFTTLQRKVFNENRSSIKSERNVERQFLPVFIHQNGCLLASCGIPL